MKKSRGFTLVELLIVTVVIAILMAIVFRLAGMGGESAARAKTISRLQKLSNAVSAYYAAFGSYPPVPLQGRSRDIHTRVNGNTMGYGIQGPASERSEGSWDKKQIEAACRAQPVGAGYPLDPETTEDADLATMAEVYHIKRYHVIDGNVGSFREGTEWSENNVFMFGLMSFLLPRYQFMLDGKQELYGFKAWLENNRVPYLLDGSRPDGWEKVQQDLRNSDLKMTALVRQMPSQAVCERWMQNFAGIVDTYPFRTRTKFFGIQTQVPESEIFNEADWLVFGAGGYDSDDSAYANNLKTVRDGWGKEFYYYSLPPYQSYLLWSSGPNKLTFPPWIDKTTLTGNQLNDVNNWTADDIKVGDK